MLGLLLMFIPFCTVVFTFLLKVACCGPLLRVGAGVLEGFLSVLALPSTFSRPHVCTCIVTALPMKDVNCACVPSPSRGPWTLDHMVVFGLQFSDGLKKS